MCKRESWAGIVAQRSSVACTLCWAAEAALLPLHRQQAVTQRGWGSLGLQESWDLA